MTPHKPTPRAFMLSFDDGPLPGRTDAVLDVLSRFCGEDGEPLRAGFFMVGDAPERFLAGRRYFAPYELWWRKGSMRRHPELVARTLAEGHVIGNHTVHHVWARWPAYRQMDAVREEIQGWETHAAAAGWNHATAPRLFRAPYLLHTPTMTAAATELGYRIVGGQTVGDATPGNGLRSVEQQIRHILNTPDTQPALLIFHDIRPVTSCHLGTILEHLQDEGHSLRHFPAYGIPAQSV
ncbi:polysaccharide deacetylase family protein [Halothiobacillus sp.]|uniref:polysaccharide deacetylase family protein n=1 Tax=Halothiobacillus sp. TaxID=1891311 RepID=UPI002614EC48|nr:polysaccharide deacetylase family protein [Halothiobacillus sp.]MDD4967404.1 polysaccharide deacetylase family protein [Halothiobacillus sp.]